MPWLLVGGAVLVGAVLAVFDRVEADAPRRLVTRIADRGLPFGGRWEYDLAPDGDGTRLVVTERGALWAVHPRGVREVQDTAIFAAARAAGLTYTKVARVSDTHTAEKLVRPRA